MYNIITDSVLLYYNIYRKIWNKKCVVPDWCYGILEELCDKKCCIFLEDKYLVYRRVYISHVV